MMIRVGRLVRAEALKLGAHPFFYVALAALAGSVLLAELLGPRFGGQEETVWRSHHAIQLFAYGAAFGMKVATFLVLVFAGMSFAGEFDRGTVKNLLVRPVTRTDVFLSKAVTIIGLAFLLHLFTLVISLGLGLSWGDLGPVWDSEQYIVRRSYDEVVGHAVKAVLMLFPSLLAVACLGMLVSNMTESSGYAVAGALVLYLLGDLVAGMLSDRAQQRMIFYYVPYAMGKLRQYAEGGSVAWNRDVDASWSWLTVPVIYAAAFLPPAFVVFRRRNITA